MLEEKTAVNRPDVNLPDTTGLPTEDGEPLESPWHRAEINLLIETLTHAWRDRDDFYTGGNMFIYFSREQARHRDYRGPDFFVVTDVDGDEEREAWVVWEENGRYPDLIIELLSPSTAEVDKTVKKRLYERTFRTPEYYCYDPATQELQGWHLQSSRYVALEPDASGRLWSDVLQFWLGTWQGTFIGRRAVWLRFFTASGEPVPTIAEAEAARAEAEAARAEAEASRAEREAARAEQEAAARQEAEKEVERLRQELARLRGEE